MIQMILKKYQEVYKLIVPSILKNLSWMACKIFTGTIMISCKDFFYIIKTFLSRKEAKYAWIPTIVLIRVLIEPQSTYFPLRGTLISNQNDSKVKKYSSYVAMITHQCCKTFSYNSKYITVKRSAAKHLRPIRNIFRHADQKLCSWLPTRGYKVTINKTGKSALSDATLIVDILKSSKNLMNIKYSKPTYLI